MPSGIGFGLIVLTSASLVAAAGAASGQGQPVNDPAGWAGAYSARFEGAAGDLTITRQSEPDDPYWLEMDMATRGCTGQLAGTGVPLDQDRLLFTIPSEFGPSELGEDACRITLTRGPDGVRVEEEHCLEFHGAACAFNGTARKRR